MRQGTLSFFPNRFRAGILYSVKQKATLDSSFWINAIAGGVVDYVLEDYELTIGPTIAQELPKTYPGGARLHALIEEKRIRVETPKASILERFGPGEREAISLAAQDRAWTLLIDDLRPSRVAEEMGLAPVSTPTYTVALYSRALLSEVEVLTALARLAARGTVSPQLIALALTQIATLLTKK